MLLINTCVKKLVSGHQYGVCGSDAWNSGHTILYIVIYLIGEDHFLWTAKLSTSFEILLRVADTVFGQASIIYASLISLERCFTVYSPLRHRTVSMRTYRLVIPMMWILVAIVTSVLHTLRCLISERLAFNLWVPYAFTLIFIVCGCNISIWRKFQVRSVASQQQNRTLQNWRQTTLMLVSIITLLSWLPIIIANSLVVNRVVIFTNWHLHIPNFLNYSNSFLNHPVYSLRILEFKQALRMCCLRRREAVSLEGAERRNNRAAALMSDTALNIAKSSKLSEIN